MSVLKFDVLFSCRWLMFNISIIYNNSDEESFFEELNRLVRINFKKF